MGLSSSRALPSASSPHGYQSTGLSLCCSRYGLVSFANLLAMMSLPCAPEEGFSSLTPNVPQYIAGQYFSLSATCPCQGAEELQRAELSSISRGRHHV